MSFELGPLLGVSVTIAGGNRPSVGIRRWSLGGRVRTRDKPTREDTLRAPLNSESSLGLWQRFRARSATEQRAAVWALVVGPPVKLALRTRGYAATVRLLERFPRAPSPQGSEGRARAAESAMQRLPFPMTCLDRSLVVWWLLGGAPNAVIRFGVAPGSQGGEAPRFHAWVVADGVVLDFDTEHLDSFLPLESPGGIQPDSFD